MYIQEKGINIRKRVSFNNDPNLLTSNSDNTGAFGGNTTD